MISKDKTVPHARQGLSADSSVETDSVKLETSKAGGGKVEVVVAGPRAKREIVSSMTRFVEYYAACFTSLPMNVNTDVD